jgi:hypothetical protein
MSPRGFGKGFLDGLKKLEGEHNVKISFALDEDGFLDRECPASNCKARFKIVFDQKEKFGDTSWCPFCGVEAAEFHTDEQRAHIKSTQLAFVRSMIGKALQKEAKDFNRRQPRNSFLTMKMTVSNRRSASPVPPRGAGPPSFRMPM